MWHTFKIAVTTGGIIGGLTSLIFSAGGFTWGTESAGGLVAVACIAWCFATGIAVSEAEQKKDN